MILSLFRKSSSAGTIPAVYAAIVAQSRHPALYATLLVPDTVTGRFDMVCLHLSLLLRRLRPDSREDREYNQALLDYFMKDMDQTLREGGVGDLSVGKRVGKMGEMFYGLLSSLNAALASGDRDQLAGVLARNIFNGETGEGLDALTDYVLGSVARLDAQPQTDIRAGRLNFGTLP